MIEKANGTQWVRNSLIIGGVVGALTGMGVAWFMVRRAKMREERLQFTAGEGVRLGLLLLGLLRSIAELGRGEE
jgi:hypothetical protein